MNESIPKTMKAAAFERFGEPEVIHMMSLPVPQPDDDEILVRVDVAGVGVWEPEIRDGSWDDGMRRFPRVLGADGSGTVVAVGTKVRRFHVGDRVYAFGFQNPKGGFYAEYAAVKEDKTAPIPSTLKADEAGALAVDGVTALLGLDQVGIEAGKTLLLWGASGGVGHLALQLAKRMGARVFAVASRHDGVELVRRLGADAAADGRHAGVLGAARKFAPNGFDAALVLAGGEERDEVLGLVNPGGRIAYPHGVEPEPKGQPSVSVRGYDGVVDRDALGRLNRLIAIAPFHVELSQVFPLEQAAQAHRRVSQHHLGKLALRVHA